MGKTLFEKIWHRHIVKTLGEDTIVMYIDRHYIHEVTSPQAFHDLEIRNLSVFNPERIIATADHNVPTINQHLPVRDPLSRKQIQTLTENCKKHAIRLYGLGHEYQGIVHVIGPELGFTLPGMTIVCGDSHTSTHGAFGTISFGIGTSQVAMVLASQCLIQSKPKQMRINVSGNLKIGVTPKDLIIYIISKLGTDGGTGYFIEYYGPVFNNMSMEGRMTVCNMSIELGARGGMIAPDDITFNYIQNKIFAPKGDKLKQAILYWQSLKTDQNASFDKEYFFNANDIDPMITYGTNPSMAIKINESIPLNHHNQKDIDHALKYMGFIAGEYMINKPINYVFIGSCTNSRIEDLRIVAKIIKGKKKANNVSVFIVPGSQQVALQVKQEGLDKLFQASGFELRQAGCSACLGMNDDKIPNGAYCISTSNRNFEGRQGPGSRTLLASPIVAAITAIEGKIVNIEQYINENNILI